MLLETLTLYKLSDLIASNVLVIGDGYRAKNSELCPFKSGLPFARAGNINSGFQFDDADYLVAENLLKAGEKVSELGDVLFTSKGTVGRVAFVSEKTPRFVYSPQLTWWRVKDTKRIEPRFLYYWMHGREFCVQINGLRGQTDMADYVSLRDQRQMMYVTLPPLDEQKAIAHILGTLDDKIELNQQMNQTLEAIARALFKSWFIDFDPVRAKLDGRQPIGMDAETAALFPAEFEDSALGNIPKEWNVGVIDNLIDILSGGTPKTSVPEYWEGNIPWFSVKDAPTDSNVYVLETEKYITEAGVNNSSTQILSEGATIVSARGTVGRLALVGVPMAMNQSCYGIKGKEGYPDLFTYYFLHSAIVSLQQQTHGTVFETITRQTFTTVKSINPPAAIAQAFNKAVQPSLHRVRSNLFEVGSLTSIRDALLPKLLSGEIRVQDAETVVEAVT